MTEYATGSGPGGGPFPASWGRPRSAPQSEERQQWAREQVLEPPGDAEALEVFRALADQSS